jgi:hypothetical protein
MKLINYSVIALILFSLTSCEKELSLELATITPVKEVELQDFILDKKFRLVDFYSGIPIDYVQNDDTVKQETNLWPYASEYLKDDDNIFDPNGTDVTINQNISTIPGNDAPVLHRKYSIIKDNNGVHLTFLDYQYNPLMYDLYKIGADYFILSVEWKPGVTLYSKFEVIP